MNVQELRLEVVVDRSLPPVSDQLVMFETGSAPDDRARWAYDHHGSAYRPADPGALTFFYQDLILGAPWPFKMGIHGVGGVDTVLAVALFTGRDLALQPGTAAFVSAVDLFHRFGAAGLAHVPADVAKFLTLLQAYFPPGLSKEEAGERLTHAVGWVREYLLEDRLPHLGAAPAPFRVVSVGSNGFMIAESDRPLDVSWAEVYRQGYLRGMVLGPDRDGQRQVVASRKSAHVEFDFGKAQRLLNEVEIAAGGDPEWRGESYYLYSPREGTFVLPSTVIELLLRC